VDIQQRAELLERTDLFREVDQATRLRIAEGISEHTFEKGEFVFKQDDPGDRMFILAQGMVKLYVSSSRHGEDEIVELVRHVPPAVFGELALLDDGPRSASAKATERSVLLSISRDDLLRLLRSEEKVAAALLRSLGMIVRRTTRQVTSLVFLDIQGRIARQLLALAGMEDGGSGTHTRRITQGELADMVGGARQTVNQALRSLQDRGVILADGRTFVILDREKLQELAEA
jgi:CRP/FNR family transcriptional regulator, cyclic AMP receptor protein